MIAIVVTAMLVGSAAFVAGAAWASVRRPAPAPTIAIVDPVRELQMLGRSVRHMPPLTRRELREMRRRRADLNSALVARSQPRRPN